MDCCTLNAFRRNNVIHRNKPFLDSIFANPEVPVEKLQVQLTKDRARTDVSLCGFIHTMSWVSPPLACPLLAE